MCIVRLGSQPVSPPPFPVKPLSAQPRRFAEEKLVKTHKLSAVSQFVDARLRQRISRLFSRPEKRKSFSVQFSNRDFCAVFVVFVPLFECLIWQVFFGSLFSVFFLRLESSLLEEIFWPFWGKICLAKLCGFLHEAAPGPQDVKFANFLRGKLNLMKNFFSLVRSPSQSHYWRDSLSVLPIFFHSVQATRKKKKFSLLPFSFLQTCFCSRHGTKLPATQAS